MGAIPYLLAVDHIPSAYAQPDPIVNILHNIDSQTMSAG